MVGIPGGPGRSAKIVQRTFQALPRASVRPAASGNMKTMKKAARSNGRLELPLPGSPPSPLGRKLMRLRRKIEASGVKLLTRAEVDREALRRRGLA